MPTRPSKDPRVQKIVELAPAFAEEVMRFAASRGETFRAVVTEALRRHMAYPPPAPEPAPLPPPAPLPDAGKPRAAKKSRKKSPTDIDPV
jgi:hypothetical protein